MAFIPFPAGTVEVHLNGTLAGIPVQNVLGAKFFTGAAGPLDGHALAVAIDNWYVAATYFSSIGNDYTQNDIEVIDLTSASGWVANLVTGRVGTAGASVVQNQVAMVVTLQTARRGRSYRGRNYLAGLPQSDLVSPSEWSLAAISTFETYYGNLMNAIQTAGWTPVVLSRVQGGVPLVLGVTTPVAAVRVTPKLGTQRGRLS